VTRGLHGSNADSDKPVQDPSSTSPWSITLPDTHGVHQAVQQWRGKVLVLNFWATWCPPCRQEMPGFSRVQTKFGPRGVQVVGLSIDTLNKVIQFQDDTPVSYPLLIGTMDLLDRSAAWGNSAQAMPFTAFFGRDGKLASVHLGQMSEQALEDQLQALLGP
jgi:peroxiredoxin